MFYFPSPTQFDLKAERIAVMVTSTTGDGDQPENAEPLWRQIKRKSLPDTTFANLKFALLGLGDTNYTQFCNAPKMFFDRFTDLGAVSFCEPGWADDGVG